MKNTSPSAPRTRPPAVPLVTHNPYFSLWSFTDSLTDSPTRHWTGTVQPLTCLVRVDGNTFRIMGSEPATTPALPQTGLSILPTRTIYRFQGAGIRLTLTFLTPLLPQDLDLYARPVSYLAWEVEAADGGRHAAQLYFDCTGELVVNKGRQPVTAEIESVPSLVVARMGTTTQEILAKKGDDLRIDWGHLYLAAPEGDAPRVGVALADAARRAFIAKATIPQGVEAQLPRPASDGSPVIAVGFDLGEISSLPVTRHILLAYDEIYSIEYLHARLRPYWRRAGASVAELLAAAERDFADLTSRLAAFDQRLMESLTQTGGAAYAELAALAYRQSLAAQTLVAGPNGQPYYFPKENLSNGCLGTVDVIYPEAPLLLMLNPALLKATLEPVFDYAQSGRWHFPFAPHDLGTYPIANGQVYGGGESSEVDQMPVEESGDMIILVAALAKADGNAEFASRYWPLLHQWAEYLRDAGLDPANQLSTDDFAGHLAHNANLSLKAILALAAFARLANILGKESLAAEYDGIARDFAQRWVTMADNGDRTRLAFDAPGSWSQKYNLVWDKILGLDLFPASLAQSEVAYYLSHMNRYGVPLDSRRTYTKLDWEIWIATLAATKKDFESLVAPLLVWANETESRVPLTDWNDTVSGKQVGFQARSVVGGIYIKMLADSAAWNEWLRAAP